MFKYLTAIFRLIFVTIAIAASGLPFLYIKYKFTKQYTNANQKIASALGKKLCNILSFLGPTYIKLGQFLSTRPDLIGFAISEELAKLQDKLPPFSSKLVMKALNNEFNNFKETFASFDITAIAAASIAQVHKATLKSGETVAVKILRPKIIEYIDRDINLFQILASIAEFFSSNAKRLRLKEVVKSLRDMLYNEIDFRIEAAAADTIRDNLKDIKDVIIPQIYWQYTSKNILVCQWLDGIAANDKNALEKANIDTHKVVKILAISFFSQAFIHGIFHADLHPGNILISQEGKVILVDFGIIGFLDGKTRIFVADMLKSFMDRDYERVAQLHFDIGYIKHNQSKEQFTMACRSIGERIVGLPVSKVSIATLLKQLLEVSEKFAIELQPKLILLQKTLLVVEGVGFLLYPEVNMWQLAEPWIDKWAKEHLSACAKIRFVNKKIKKSIKKLPDFVETLEKLVQVHYESVRNTKNDAS